MILVVLVYWLTSTAYVIHHYYKNGEKEFGVILMALLLGPILVFIIKDNEKETIEGNDIPNFRSIPPPPPKPQHKKDFKFFQK